MIVTSWLMVGLAGGFLWAKSAVTFRGFVVRVMLGTAIGPFVFLAVVTR